MKVFEIRKIKTQYGDYIPVTLTITAEGWVHSAEPSCWSSSALGLGNCRCISHDPWGDEYFVSPREALKLLREAGVSPAQSRYASKLAKIAEAIHRLSEADVDRLVKTGRAIGIKI